MKNTIIIILIVLITVSLYSTFTFVSPGKETNLYSEQQDIDPAAISDEKRVEEKSLLKEIFISWWWFILYYGTCVVIGVFVYRDACQNRKLALNIKPFWWGVIVVFDPALGVLTYWLIHYSKLNTVNINDNT